MAGTSGGIQRCLLFVMVMLRVCVLTSSLPSSSSSSSKPHIILIVADDLGWYEVSWHNPKAITPRMEKLATEGIILEQSYVQPSCTPTRSALLTGKYPFTIGRQHEVIRPSAPTGLLLNATLMPQAFKDAGYSTHIVGKWHLGCCHWDYTPTKRGFDTFYGYYNGKEDYYRHTRLFGAHTKRHSPFKDKYPHGYDFRNNTEPDISVKGIYSTYAFSSYVDHLLSSRKPDDPMFLYLPFQSVHSPLQVPKKYEVPFQYIHDKNRLKKLAMVWAMDEAIGAVVDSLQSTGHYDNSIIVFTTDNGGPVNSGGINWPLRGGKLTIFEGGTRGPAFIHSPLLSKKGFTSNTLVHVTDWYETLVRLGGGVAPKDTDGFDQWEAITTGSASPRPSMVYNIDNEDQIQAGIRKGDFKLLVGNPGNGAWHKPPEDDTSSHHFRNRKINDPKDWVTFGKLNINKRTFTQLGNSVNNDTAIWLFNLIDDPYERDNIAESRKDLVEDLMDEIEKELLRYVPADNPRENPKSNPKYFDNVWSPGWCNP